MIKGPKLTKTQWDLLAKAFSNMSQAVLLFSLAALFVPESVLLGKDFPKLIASIFFFCGLTMLATGIILIKKGK